MSEIKPENACAATSPCGSPTASDAMQKTKAAVPTKTAQLIRLLRRKNGADLATLSNRLGWQPHTTRAALSRLRKAGHNLTREPSESGKPSRYRIID